MNTGNIKHMRQKILKNLSMLYQYYAKNSVYNGHLGINSTCFPSKNINFTGLEIYNQTFFKQIFLVIHEFSEMLYAPICVFSFISSKLLESSVKPNYVFYFI